MSLACSYKSENEKVVLLLETISLVVLPVAQYVVRPQMVIIGCGGSQQ